MEIKKMLQYNEGKTCNTVFSGRIGLMCPKCYSYVVTESDINMKAEIHTGDDLLIHPMYRLNCPDCHERNAFIEIDLMIAGDVSELNKKGYKTEMCCEGHIGIISLEHLLSLRVV